MRGTVKYEVYFKSEWHIQVRYTLYIHVRGTMYNQVRDTFKTEGHLISERCIHDSTCSGLLRLLSEDKIKLIWGLIAIRHIFFLGFRHGEMAKMVKQKFTIFAIDFCHSRHQFSHHCGEND